MLRPVVPHRAGRTEVTMSRTLRGFLLAESGQDLIEYALLASFLSLASIAALKFLGPRIAKSFGPVIGAL
jgi:Flp pilus assembly pilin Flp